MRLRRNAKLDLLKSTPLFAQCSRRDLARIAQIAEEVSVEAGRVLIREGERGREFFVIVTGDVEVRRRGRRVGSLGAGSFFGELALLSRAPRSATVTASTPLEVLVITDRHFVALLDRAPEIWLKVARALAERLDADEARERTAARGSS
ncbi:MAG TPA: cyclic nucleotide-binding domain-containing protein [Gaiella sp.]